MLLAASTEGTNPRQNTCGDCVLTRLACVLVWFVPGSSGFAQQKWNAWLHWGNLEPTGLDGWMEPHHGTQMERSLSAGGKTQGADRSN